MVEIASAAGLDFVILDLEHGAWDFASLENAIRGAEGAGAAPLVRVADLAPSTFQRVLDLGAHGVVVPQVRSVADAEAAVRAARYAPLGSRGYNPFTRAAEYAAPDTNAQGKLDPAYPAVGVIIENAEAFAALPAICAVEGLSFIYLGVYDMSLALGCSGDVRHPKVQAFVSEACQVAVAHGKAVSMMVRSVADITTALGLGARILVWGVDANILYEAYRGPAAYLATIKAAESAK
jgi:4-hydroxy-2-oxoheptanedioate aldolase